jgi:creatinine amidohydrolase
MKTMKKSKNLLLVASVLIIGGAFTVLLTGFVAGVSPGDKDLVKKEKSEKKKEVKTWRWEEMFPSDMREALEEMPVAWVLFSPLEWHGEAMAFGTDPIIGQHVLDKAWKQVGGVRIPTVYVGVETDFKYLDKGMHSHWGLEVITKDHNYGSIYARPVTLQLVLEDYLYFLKREGFKMAVVSTGHGGTEHLIVMREVCERFSDENFKAVLPRRGTIPEELRIKSSGGHASVGELSLLGAINPNLVDADKYGVTEQDRKVNLLKEEKDKIDFEKAAKIIEIYANGMAEAVQEMYDEMIKGDQ